MYMCLNDYKCKKCIEWIKKYSNCEELGCYKANEYIKGEFIEPDDLMNIFYESVELYNKFIELDILGKINDSNISKYIKALGCTDKMREIYFKKIENSELKEGLSEEQKKSICVALVSEYI